MTPVLNGVSLSNRLQEKTSDPPGQGAGPRILRRAALGMGLAGLALLVWASSGLEQRVASPAVLLALAGGLLLWAVIAWASPPSDRLDDLDPPASGPRLLPLAISVVGAGLCAWKMPAKEFHLAGLVFWVEAVAAWLWAWWPPRVSRTPAASSPAGRLSARARLTALAAVVALGSFFLYYRLAAAPANPVSDQAEEMLDLFDLLNGRFWIFFPRNLGVAPLHFYWTGALLAVLKLPLRFLTVKVATSAMGLLAIPAIYLAGSELGGAWLGLSAAAFMAWGKWPVSLARQGLEYIYAVPPTIFVIWALLRYMRRGDRVSALAAGVGVGIGLYTYPSFRIVPLLVVVAFAMMLLDRRRAGARRILVGHGFLVAATAALVFLPLGKFAVLNRSQFWYRSFTRITDLERKISGDRLQTFAGNLRNMARAFHWEGSAGWTVMTRYDPFLDIVLGGLLFAGVVLLAGLALRGAWRWTWVLLALFVLTLPSTLALAFPGENPSLNRAGPAIPVVFLIAALPFAYLCANVWRLRGALRAAGFLALAGACVLSVQQNFRSYFGVFAEGYDRMIDHSTQMAEILEEHHARGVPYSQCYLLGYAGWVDGRNIALEIGDPGWYKDHIVMPDEVPADLRERPLVFLYSLIDTERLARLRRVYPGTERIVHQSHSDRDFGVYVVR
jgi:hypothetical protein